MRSSVHSPSVLPPIIGGLLEIGGVVIAGAVAGFACVNAAIGSGLPAAAVVDAATVGESVLGFRFIGSAVAGFAGVNAVVPAAACG